MPITTLPTRTEGAGAHELGQTKAEDGTYTDATKQVKAAFWNRVLDYLIDLATEVGKTDGSTVGSLREAVNTKVPTTRTLTAGTGLTGGGDLSANRSFAVDIAGTNPQPIGTAAPGASGKVSDRDHIHAHGDQSGGSLHALVTDAAHGFLDKDIYDGQLGKRKKWQKVLEETFKGVLHGKLFGAASGAGAIATASAAASTYLSVGILGTGTTTSGYARWYSYINFWYDNAGDKCLLEFVGSLLNVPDGTDDFYVRLCGIGLPSGSETGYSFSIDRGVSATNWLISKWNAGTPTHTVTSVAFDTNRHRFTSVYDQTADSVEFFIDGVSVGTVTGVPTGLAAQYLYLAEIRKFAGTTDRRLYGEWGSAFVQYTTARPG